MGFATAQTKIRDIANCGPLRVPSDHVGYPDDSTEEHVYSVGVKFLAFPVAAQSDTMSGNARYTYANDGRIVMGGNTVFFLVPAELDEFDPRDTPLKRFDVAGLVPGCSKSGTFYTAVYVRGVPPIVMDEFKGLERNAVQVRENLSKIKWMSDTDINAVVDRFTMLKTLPSNPRVNRIVEALHAKWEHKYLDRCGHHMLRGWGSAESDRGQAKIEGMGHAEMQWPTGVVEQLWGEEREATSELVKRSMPDEFGEEGITEKIQKMAGTGVEGGD